MREQGTALILDAVAPAFLVCGALALLAAAGLLVSTRARLARAAIASCAIAGGLGRAQAGLAAMTTPDPVVIAGPCGHRGLPKQAGFEGMLQEGALALLDEAACFVGTSREELLSEILENESSPRSLLDRLGIP